MKNPQILPFCILMTPCNWRQQWVCPPLLHLHLFHPLARVNCNHPHSHTLSLIFPFLSLFLQKSPPGSTTANPVNPHGIDNILNRFPLELPKLWYEIKIKQNWSKLSPGVEASPCPPPRPPWLRTSRPWGRHDEDDDEDPHDEDDDDAAPDEDDDDDPHDDDDDVRNKKMIIINPGLVFQIPTLVRALHRCKIDHIVAVSLI